jgi:hypothetical protein
VPGIITILFQYLLRQTDTFFLLLVASRSKTLAIRHHVVPFGERFAKLRYLSPIKLAQFVAIYFWRHLVNDSPFGQLPSGTTPRGKCVDYAKWPQMTPKW